VPEVEEVRKLTPEERVIRDKKIKEKAHLRHILNRKQINEKSTQWRIDNPDRVKASNRKWVERRRMIRICCIILKGGCCSRCGTPFNGKNGCIFTFHHRDPTEKEFELSHNLKLRTLAEEIEKCDLVCENCHKLIHAGVIE